MVLYPKDNIRNVFGDIIFKKDKAYECTKIADNWFIVKCELIANEYPSMDSTEIKRSFYTESQKRDLTINNLLK